MCSSNDDRCFDDWNVKTTSERTEVAASARKRRARAIFFNIRYSLRRNCLPYDYGEHAYLVTDPRLVPACRSLNQHENRKLQWAERKEGHKGLVAMSSNSKHLGAKPSSKTKEFLDCVDKQRLHPLGRSAPDLACGHGFRGCGNRSS